MELDLDELRAAYDHPADKSVIELIDRLEQAERNADTYQKLYEQRAESLEQAEQAVARVREFLEYRKANSAVARDGLHALDGETNV